MRAIQNFYRGLPKEIVQPSSCKDGVPYSTYAALDAEMGAAVRHHPPTALIPREHYTCGFNFNLDKTSVFVNADQHGDEWFVICTVTSKHDFKLPDQNAVEHLSGLLLSPDDKFTIAVPVGTVVVRMTSTASSWLTEKLNLLAHLHTAF